jgi:hypothetical protein
LLKPKHLRGDIIIVLRYSIYKILDGFVPELRIETRRRVGDREDVDFVAIRKFVDPGLGRSAVREVESGTLVSFVRKVGIKVADQAMKISVQ